MKTTIKKTSAALLLIIISACLSAQQKELKVLFVGNSYTYNNNLPHIVAILSENTGTKLITRRSVAGGAWLWEHWNGKKGLETREIIENGNFDIVILQDNSMSTLSAPDSTLKYIRKFSAFNNEYGAKTYLFNTWAREKVPQFQETIDEVYAKGAEESGSVRVPVGAAWKLAMDLRPGVDLYNSDGSHPTQLGTVLTAMMFVKAITGELPERFPMDYKTTDFMGEEVVLLWMDPMDSEFCRRITEEVLDD